MLEVGSGMEFWDQFDHKIDGKGRLSLPVPYREGFIEEDGGFVAWLGDHIAVMPKNTWYRFFRSLEDDEDLSPEDLRVFASWASPFKLDSQGRLVLNARLRQHAGVADEVTLVGSKTYIALYPRDVWEEITIAERNASLSRKLASKRVL